MQRGISVLRHFQTFSDAVMAALNNTTDIINNSVGQSRPGCDGIRRNCGFCNTSPPERCSGVKPFLWQQLETARRKIRELPYIFQRILTMPSVFVASSQSVVTSLIHVIREIWYLLPRPIPSGRNPGRNLNIQFTRPRVLLQWQRLWS